MEPAGGSAEQVGEERRWRSNESSCEWWGGFFSSLFFNKGRPNPSSVLFLLFSLCWELPVWTNETWRKRPSWGGRRGGGMMLLSSCQSVPSGEHPEDTRLTRPAAGQALLWTRTSYYAWETVYILVETLVFLWPYRLAVCQYMVGIHATVGWLSCISLLEIQCGFLAWTKELYSRVKTVVKVNSMQYGMSN